MSTKAHITLNMFTSVKTLIQAGAKDAEIEKFLHVSRSTVARIKRAETFEEYKQIQAAYMIAKRKKEQERKERQEQEALKKAEEQKEEPKPEAPAPAPAPVPVPAPQNQSAANYQILQLTRIIDSQNAKLNTVIEIMRKQSELLTTISAKIAFVVDELTK